MCVNATFVIYNYDSNILDYFDYYTINIEIYAIFVFFFIYSASETMQG